MLYINIEFSNCMSLLHWIFALLSMTLTALCRVLFHLLCRKLDIPLYAKPMKLETSVVIIPHFCILGILRLCTEGPSYITDCLLPQLH